MDNQIKSVSKLLVPALLVLLASVPSQAEILIDTHSHLNSTRVDSDNPCSIQDADPCTFETPLGIMLDWMTRYSVDKTIIMPQPSPGPYNPHLTIDCRHYPNMSAIVQAHPGVLYFSGGGASLNKILHSNAGILPVTPGQMSLFKQTAKWIAFYGAVGYGELAIDHLSLRDGHPYEHVRADHPFLLALTTYSAIYGMPISVHMEAIPRNMQLPSELAQFSSNPSQLSENIRAFETLLSTNRKAKIIWLHGGWDNTGHRSVRLMSYLLRRHSNLYIDLKLRKNRLNSAPNHPLNHQWDLKPEWKEFLETHKDRILIGQDQHYIYNTGTGAAARMRVLISQLSPVARKRITSQNAMEIFTRIP